MGLHVHGYARKALWRWDRSMCSRLHSLGQFKHGKCRWVLHQVDRIGEWASADRWGQRSNGLLAQQQHQTRRTIVQPGGTVRQALRVPPRPHDTTNSKSPAYATEEPRLSQWTTAACGFLSPGARRTSSMATPGFSRQGWGAGPSCRSAGQVTPLLGDGQAPTQQRRASS